MKKATFVLAAIMIIAACTKESTQPLNTNTTTTINNDTTIVQKAKWVKVKTHIQYKADGVTEQFRSDYEFDSEGRQISFVQYNNGVKSAENINMVYNGDECTFTQKIYSNGVLVSSTPSKIVYENN